MRKTRAGVFILILLIHTLIIPNFLIIEGFSEEQILNPPYGAAPVLDGYINKSADEWGAAEKTTLRLYNNASQTDMGIPIDLWVLQNETNLYIMIRFELQEDHYKDDQFVGFLISERVPSDQDTLSNQDFVDAKIIQFKNINTGEFVYEEYNLDNYTFTKDVNINGEGFAAFDSDGAVIYEFCIPINNSGDPEDVFLDYGEKYGFRIIFGESDIHPDNINKFNLVYIRISYPKEEPEDTFWLWVRLILSIIIFSGLGLFMGFYFYKIIILKKKVERIKGE